jgi:adenylate cyclase class 2
MSFEVEQKFRTDGHDAVAARLAELGHHAGSPVEQEDAYLSHPQRDFATTREALRIRRVGEENAITYKGPRLEGPTKTREELEIGFAPGREAHSQMCRLFEILGFRPVAVVRKVRTTYHLTWDGRDVEVVLDEVPGLGVFVEVETIAAEEADLKETQRVIGAVAAALGLKEVEPRSYLQMTLERLASGADGVEKQDDEGPIQLG